MKHRYFLLTILLLMCVLIPLQRASALTMKVRGDSSVTTKTTDTDDITFTVRFIGVAGSKHFLTLAVTAPTTAIARQTQPVPSFLRINGRGRHDVTVTIPRSVMPTTTGTQKYTFLAGDGLNPDLVFQQIFTVNVILPTDETVEVDLRVKGNLIQELPANEIRDIVFTLQVTNNSNVPNLRIQLAVVESELVLVELDITQVQLSPTLVTLAPNASEEVTLTIPGNLFTESGSYVVTVSATPEGGLTENVAVRVSVIPTAGLVLEPVTGWTHTTTTTETYNVSYLLRLSNTGSDPDRITLALSTDFRAWLDQSEVVLFPDSFEDIELTIPRASLTNAGTYEVVVIAHSGNDPNVNNNIILTTTVMEDLATLTDPTERTDPTDPTRQTPPDLSTDKVVFSEFMFESEGGENSLPQWIEVYNNSSSETNLRGWKLQWKRLQPSLLEVTTVFKEDFIIPAQQSRLIVTALGRHSGGGGAPLRRSSLSTTRSACGGTYARWYSKSEPPDYSWRVLSQTDKSQR